MRLSVLGQEGGGREEIQGWTCPHGPTPAEVCLPNNVSTTSPVSCPGQGSSGVSSVSHRSPEAGALRKGRCHTMSQLPVSVCSLRSEQGLALVSPLSSQETPLLVSTLGERQRPPRRPRGEELPHPSHSLSQ